MQMRKNTLLTLVTTLLLIMWMPPASAQGNSAAVAARQAEIVKLKEKIVAIDQRRREDVTQLNDSRKRLQEAQAELRTAKVDFSGDGSELNTRRVKNAEFAAMLKQRELDRLEERQQNYNVATKQTALKIEALQQQITDLKAGKAPPAPSSTELAKTQQELDAARARNEAAKQEMVRLRAMMAEANAKTAAAAKVAPAAAGAAPAAAVAAGAVQPALKPADVSPAPEAAKTALSKEQRFAIDQYERIAKMFREKGLDEKEGPEKEMLIDAMVDFWIESKRTLVFGYLGHGQYIVETKLRNGEATFVIGEQRWRHTVPEQDDNMTYMFLLDTTTKPNDELYFFRKDLLLVD